MKTWQSYISFLVPGDATNSATAPANSPAATPRAVPRPARAPARARPRRPSDADVLASVLKNSEPAEFTPPPARKLDWTLPGFERRARVATIFGDLPIEALRLRDKVKTISGAFKQVQWIDEIRLDADFMARHPEAHPVMIRARALDGAMPCENILVSPGQEIWSPRHSGQSLARAASDLDGLPNITRLHRAEVTYYRFHCGAPETVSVEGAWFRVAPEG